MPQPSWTIYGYREDPRPGNPEGRAPMHAEGFKSEADATLWLMDHILKHGVAQVNCVLVHLPSGTDGSGREVVRRIGEGRAWWE